MRQSLHIFRKDVRHLWIEIGISLAITAAFVLTYPHTWRPKTLAMSGAWKPIRDRQLDMLAQVMVGLVPVSWWLLIARAVHGESLVGRRQFWITRPYDWRALLGAKLLFVAVFIVVPFFVAQCLLLMEAGFDPRQHLAGLAFNLFLITGALILPLMAAATVTANFGWMALWIVGLAAYIGGVALIYSWLGIVDVSTPVGDPYSLPIMVLVTASVIGVQYARRRAWLAHGLLASVAVVVGLMALFLPTQGMIDAAYIPSASGLDLPMQVNAIDGPESSFKVRPGDGDKEVQLEIPLETSGVAARSAVFIEDAKAVLEGRDGTVLKLPWRAIYNYRFLPGEYALRVAIPMKRSDYERMRGKPVRIVLGLAMTEAKAEKTTEMALPNAETVIPGFGICPPGAWGNTDGDGQTGECRFAMNTPRLTYVSITADRSACPETDAEDDDSVVSGWIGGLDPGLAEMGITSVWTSSLGLHDSKNKYIFRACPKGTMRLTAYHAVRRVRTQVSLPAMLLPEEEKRDVLMLR